jgi:Domain of unknown function (DUF4267)
MQGRRSKRATVLLVVAGLVGVLLGVIGLRSLVLPESAAYTFGVPVPAAGHELHYIIGLRNLWLGALAIGLAALRQWHGLALWFVAGTAVCFADGLIVAKATGQPPQVAFHVLCGLLYALLAALCWSRGAKGR